jgi:glycosyltransferase involved in cell wall biosynthesis
MRNVLLVSYFVPPRVGVGSTRARQLMTHLTAHGWNVTAVTGRLEGASLETIQTGFVDTRALLKRLLGIGNGSTHTALGVEPAHCDARRSLRQWTVELGYALAGYPDGFIGWFPAGRRTLKRLLPGRFDAIISSSPPFTTNLMVGSLRLGIPWIADFRDLWADSYAYDSRMRRICDRALERWSLRHAAALTTISKPMARTLQRHHPRTRVEVIPNAFDAAEWSTIPFSEEERCTFVYAGALYDGRCNPRMLFRVLRSLIDEGAIHENEVRVDFYASSSQWLAKMIYEAGIANVVRVLGTVPREEVLEAERRADRLLVMLWDGPRFEGLVTGKLFEYLGARRRIMVLGGPKQSAVDEILGTTSAGVRCTTDAVLRAEVIAAVREHRANRVMIVEELAVAPYEASVLAGRFAALLDSLVSARAPGRRLSAGQEERSSTGYRGAVGHERR